MFFDQDERRRLLVAELSQTDLIERVEELETESARLAARLERDRVLAGARDVSRLPPLGKLAIRLVRTRARWNECRAQHAAASAELRRRGRFRLDDWDEPTLTDLEDLADELIRRAERGAQSLSVPE